MRHAFEVASSCVFCHSCLILAVITDILIDVISSRVTIFHFISMLTFFALEPGRFDTSMPESFCRLLMPLMLWFSSRHYLFHLPMPMLSFDAPAAIWDIQITLRLIDLEFMDGLQECRADDSFSAEPHIDASPPPPESPHSAVFPRAAFPLKCL